MGDAKPGCSASSAALDALLGGESPESTAITARFHRTMLWRLRTGRRFPDLQSAIEIERLSAGQVPASGWEILKQEEPAKVPA